MTPIRTPEELGEWLCEGHPKYEVVEADVAVWLTLLRDEPELGFAIADRPEAPELFWRPYLSLVMGVLVGGWR